MTPSRREKVDGSLPGSASWGGLAVSPEETAFGKRGSRRHHSRLKPGLPVGSQEAQRGLTTTAEKKNVLFRAHIGKEPAPEATAFAQIPWKQRKTEEGAKRRCSRKVLTLNLPPDVTPEKEQQRYSMLQTRQCNLKKEMWKHLGLKAHAMCNNLKWLRQKITHRTNLGKGHRGAPCTICIFATLVNFLINSK